MDSGLTDMADRADAPSFIDLHVHPCLPWVGAAWRRAAQDFRLATLDNAPGRGETSVARPDARVAMRLYGAVFYQTYLFRPAVARRNLFASLEAFGSRLASLGGRRLLLSASDLQTLPVHLSGALPPIPIPEAFLMAVESMRYLNDPGDVRRLWNLGVRSLQPIHFLDTPWGGSSREGLLPESRKGLTGLGKEMLSEMASLGMILDIAHMSARNAEESLAAYRGPVMCSHTGLHSLKPSARNVNVDLAREIFRRRGVVGVTCWRHLLGPDPLRASGSDRRLAALSGPRSAWTRAYCATVDAIASLSPDSRVAVGSDRGAPIRAPGWFYSTSHLAEIGTCLEEAGWNADRIRGFLSRNAWDFLSRSLPGGNGS